MTRIRRRESLPRRGERQVRRSVAAAAAGAVVAFTTAIGGFAPALALGGGVGGASAPVGAVSPVPPGPSPVVVTSDDETHLPYGTERALVPRLGDGSVVSPEALAAAGVRCGFSNTPTWTRWRWFNCTTGPVAVHYRSSLYGHQCMTVTPYVYSATRIVLVDRLQYVRSGTC